MLKSHFDDPLDAVAVHVGGGSVGIFFVHIFSFGEGIFWKVTAFVRISRVDSNPRLFDREL